MSDQKEIHATQTSKTVDARFGDGADTQITLRKDGTGELLTAGGKKEEFHYTIENLTVHTQSSLGTEDWKLKTKRLQFQTLEARGRILNIQAP